MGRIDVIELFNPKYIIYSHTSPDREKELLKDHISLCEEVWDALIKEKNLDILFEKMEMQLFPQLSKEGKKFLRQLREHIPSFHDVGKTSPGFQKKLRNFILTNMLADGNPRNIKDLGGSHSLLSAIFYINYFYIETRNLEVAEEEGVFLRGMILLHAFIIARHHSNLQSMAEFARKLLGEGQADFFCQIFRHQDQTLYQKKFKLNKIILKNIKEDYEKIHKAFSEEQQIVVAGYIRLVYSLLIASDYYSTSSYMQGTKLPDFTQSDYLEELSSPYYRTDVYQSVQNYRKNHYGKKERNLVAATNINVMRSEMCLDALEGLQKNLEASIYFLEAPTGSGKSNTALNLSFELAKNNSECRKIFYVYPFNTLVEQNESILASIYKDQCSALDSIAVINSITPIKVKDGNRKEEETHTVYESAYMDWQFLTYPMILTTHVRFFELLFSAQQSGVCSFFQLAHSIVVLDEIQSYKNDLWTEIMMFLQVYAPILDIKIIIMSATLPDLSYLTEKTYGVCNLISQREKYFFHPLFKNRVKIYYDLLEKDLQMEDLEEHVRNHHKGKKTVIEWIYKKSAEKFYNKLCENCPVNCRVLLITGDDSIAERKKILAEFARNSKEDVILVATQVIEAGVDMDADLGYKDISKLDSEEQFLGRINRSCKRSGEVYFFDIDNEKRIYKNDFRMVESLTLRNTEMREVLESKEFRGYYISIMAEMKKKQQEDSTKNSMRDFMEEGLGKLNFDKIQEHMKLIDDKRFHQRVFFARSLALDDGSALDGREIWKEYKELVYDSVLSYAERKVKLSMVRSKMAFFLYELSPSSTVSYNDDLGGILYIEEGEKYFENRKLRRELLEQNELIL